jgi:hypothetical protein
MNGRQEVIALVSFSFARLAIANLSFCGFGFAFKLGNQCAAKRLRKLQCGNPRHLSADFAQP